MKRTLAFAVLFLAAACARGDDWTHEELKRFPAEEAVQGVAVDGDHFYAISNRAIGKYRKDTGERVARWEDSPDGRIRHLNAGVVIEGRLYCAHSNFPAMPEESSVEIFDPVSMRHLGSRTFPDPPGSLTWIDRREGSWYACFAHYRKSGDPANSGVVKYDAAWKPLVSWSFPPALIDRFDGYSASGGAFGSDGTLFVSGHDARELYLLELPPEGGEAHWASTLPVSAAGQAFAWDKSEAKGILYAIERSTREVIVSRVTKKVVN